MKAEGVPERWGGGKKGEGEGTKGVFVGLIYRVWEKRALKGGREREGEGEGGGRERGGRIGREKEVEEEQVNERGEESERREERT